jgi:uncharacterized repeat protein (TIGR02543 family)
LTLNVTFYPASFSGTKNEYLYALDSSGVYTGWQQMGTWTVPAPPAPDFTLTTVTDSYYVQTGVTSYPSYTLTITPQNGFNSPVSFSMSWPMYGCGYPSYNPNVVTGPPWTTTVSMQCYETLQNGYWTQVTASGGGKSHQLILYLYVAQNPQSFLTATVTPANGGYISPGSGWYSTGSYLTITATPASGYQFSAFAGVDSSNGSTGYVTMNGNRSVSAFFTQTVTSYSLTTSVSPSGSGTLTFSPPCCTYNAGMQVTITASAASGYQFNGWTGVDSSSGTTGYVTMNSNRSVTANFTSIGNTVADPTFTPAGGSYGSAQNVTISTTTPGASIRYTTDGSIPTATTGTLYSGPVAVNVSETLKAIAYETGWNNSNVVLAVYSLGGTLTITTTSLSNASVCTAYSASLNATGGSPPYTWTLINGTTLPPGLTLSGNTISGTPTAAGTYAFTVQVTDKAAGTASTGLNIVVNAAAAVPSREYIRLGGRVVAVANCGGQ